MTIPRITIEQAKIMFSAVEANMKLANELIDKANGIALAEQQESEYITAAQARELGAGNAEWKSGGYSHWQICGEDFQYFSLGVKYRAIKQAQPEPVDEQLYCMVSKDGEPAIRMLRTEAQALHRTLGNTVYWGILDPPDCYADSLTTFNSGCIYTYRTRATIKLDGNMVTPEQAAAEWEAKKKTHDVYSISKIETTLERNPRFSLTAASGYWYELRPKQPTWTGGRDDVIALLKELGLL